MNSNEENLLKLSNIYNDNIFNNNYIFQKYYHIINLYLKSFNIHTDFIFDINIIKQIPLEYYSLYPPLLLGLVRLLPSNNIVDIICYLYKHDKINYNLFNLCLIIYY